MTAQRQPPVPETHCRFCGGRLDIRITDRPGYGQRSAETTCTQCGRTGGYSWTTYGSRRPRQSTVSRVLSAVRLRRSSPKYPRPPRSLPVPGKIDIRELAEAASFPVYGLKGRPHGLRLRSIGRGGHSETPIGGVSASYITGHPRNPDSALSIEQFAESPYSPQLTPEQFERARAYDELHAIENTLRNNASPEEIARWHAEGNFNRDWNIERILKTEHTKIEAHIAGQSRTLTTASWDSPHRVAVFSFHLPPVFMVVCSLNLSPDETVAALGTLVELRGNDDAAQEHEEDFTAMFNLLWPQQE